MPENQVTDTVEVYPPEQLAQWEELRGLERRYSHRGPPGSYRTAFTEELQRQAEHMADAIKTSILDGTLPALRFTARCKGGRMGVTSLTKVSGSVEMVKLFTPGYISRAVSIANFCATHSPLNFAEQRIADLKLTLESVSAQTTLPLESPLTEFQMFVIERHIRQILPEMLQTALEPLQARIEFLTRALSLKADR